MIDVFVQGVKIDLVSGKAAYAFVRGGKPYFPVVCLRDSGDVSSISGDVFGCFSTGHRPKAHPMS